MRLSRSAIALLAAGSSVLAFNHPEIRWRSVTTDHFVINYYDRTEPLLYAAWKIAEESYAVLAELYQYESDRKIHLSLADYDDYSNGWADWLSGSIMIWTADARFELRGNATWLRTVITHEIAHAISLAQRRKKQTLAWTLAFNYTSPSFDLTYQEPFARMTFLPEWLSEGLAQRGSERLSADRWDARRDMVLRCAVLAGKELSLAAMSHFSHDALGNELVYNQGYAFTAFLEQCLGEETLHGLIATAARERHDFAELFETKTGTSLERMYVRWLDSLKTTYRARSALSVTSGSEVWPNGFINLLPRVSRDGRWWGWLTNHKDDGYRTDLLIARVGSSRPVARIPYAKTAWDFSADSRSVYYVKARRSNRHGSFFNDIYTRRIGSQREQRLTKDARAYDIAAAPDGSALAVTRFHNGAFGLYLYEPRSGKWTILDPGECGSPFLSPAFNPTNPTELVVTRIVSGNADLYVMNIPDRSLRPITATPAQEETPVWAADGRIYFSADDDGVFDVYSVAPDGSDRRRHSRALGGMFAPQTLPDGRVLAAEYTAEGFRIATFSPRDEPAAATDSLRVPFRPLPEPSDTLRIDGVAYLPRFLRPYWEMSTFADVTVDGAGLSGERYHELIGGMGITMYRSDALGKKNLALGANVGLLAGVYYPPDSTGNDSAGMAGSLEPVRSTRDRLRDRSLRGRRLQFTPDPRGIRSTTLGVRQFPMGTSAGDSTDNGVEFHPPSIYLQPYWLYERATGRPLYGMFLTGALAMGMGVMMPALVMAESYWEWHLARDLYLGLSPSAELYPTYGFTYYVTAPLQLQWFRSGRYEEDQYYTMRDVLALTVSCGPQVFPADSTSEHRGGLAAVEGGVTFVYGIPLLRSSAFVLSASGSVVNGTSRFLTPVLGHDGASDIYGAATLGGRLVFPLAKHIDRGTRLYADALHAGVSYEGTIIANRTFAEQAGRNELERVLTQQDGSRHAVCEHVLGLDLTLGLYKRYLLFRTLRMRLAYGALRRQLHAALALAF